MSKLPRSPVVYLAGGMRSNWQDTVISALPGVVFIDPRKSGSTAENVYTAYDLTGVQMCDIVFGYIEADNPCGAGLAVEAGAAAALGKHFIYVEDPGFTHHRYFGMVRALADSNYPRLPEGIEALAYLCGFERQPGHTGYRLKLWAPELRLPQA